jgi:hypothetical protein
MSIDTGLPTSMAFGVLVRFFAKISPTTVRFKAKQICFLAPQFFLMDENDPLNRFIHFKIQNYVFFCHKIAPEGEKYFEKRLLFMNFPKFYAKI